ncbi:hypothetical protein W97_06971 [Coniosporium apollinis CBS 100218]|uniref:3-oxoacyl-[acyl-carrier protein] reductase n=1 Tax=Coniosporium apollinis (strain CBS 100218) TaxID=1168221 RepID=R7Z0L7_CONA1|nr:uncharacterized protein W97_06971 [Coniosporium apollinis CBS 100218]EON67603.1 hypothetical protein W97_06971 [Coniosporium apollinis CBS 100218]
MSSSFEGRVIAITGAASGMGLALSKLLSSRGASLSLADVQESALSSALEAVKAESSNSSAKFLTCKTDVRDRSQVDAWIKQTVDELGGLHGAANLAGVIGRNHDSKGVEDQDSGEWDFVLGVNLTGVMHCLSAQVRHFSKEGGSIVNAASIAGLMGRPNTSAYVASKHGVIGLTRSVAKETGVRRIRVNCIAPGYILTPMVEKASKISDQPVDTNPEIKATALQRAGKAEEVARLIAFLLSEESSYITGAVHTIDGGWVC